VPVSRTSAEAVTPQGAILATSSVILRGQLETLKTQFLSTHTHGESISAHDLPDGNLLLSGQLGLLEGEDAHDSELV